MTTLFIRPVLRLVILSKTPLKLSPLLMYKLVALVKKIISLSVEHDCLYKNWDRCKMNVIQHEVHVYT